ncbi:MAG: hypothetical protein Aurels2KO_05990 [Aureliella sp.]
MIELVNVSLQAGAFELSDVSIRIDAGQYAVLMGRTGIGKTTILEAICGLRRVKAGRILIGGHDVTQMLPGDRNVGYVPQDLALFPTLTVQGHLEFAQRLRKVPREEMLRRVDELAGQLGIKSLLQRSIHGLSGGEAQRVAIGRALAMQPKVLLLDEPLSALDKQTRSETAAILANLKQRRVTILHVTHNEEEAQQLSDRLFILEGGQIVDHEVA